MKFIGINLDLLRKTNAPYHKTILLYFIRTVKLVTFSVIFSDTQRTTLFSTSFNE